MNMATLPLEAIQAIASNKISYRGMRARIARELGVHSNTVCLIAKGQSGDARVVEAILAEVAERKAYSHATDIGVIHDRIVAQASATTPPPASVEQSVSIQAPPVAAPRWNWAFRLFGLPITLSVGEFAK